MQTVIGLIDPNDYWSSARSGGKDGLGIIPLRPEINRSLSGFGIAPNDRELARTRGYLPVHHGWINTKHKTYWNGALGEGETEAPSSKSEKIQTWAAVVGAASSAVIALALLLRS